MQFTQKSNSSGAVTIALNEPKANLALVKTVRAEECTQMQELATHLRRLLARGTLEKAGCVLFEHFGKIKRPYLTPLEEQLLRLL